MVHSIREMYEAELEMGIDAAIMDPDAPAGGTDIPTHRRGLDKSKPWTWSYEQKATLNVLSSTIPDIFPELPHPILIAHGMPDYCVYSELVEGYNAFQTTMEMLRICEASICWSQKEASFWRIASDKPTHYLERGCDLKYWVIDGPAIKFRYHPVIVYAEVPRPVKNPLNLLVALKEVRRKYYPTKLELIGLDAKTQSTWAFIIGSLGLSMGNLIEAFVVGMHDTPGHYYRGADIVFSSVQGGLMSRVGVESLACGVPTIITEGCPEKIASAKCEDTPEKIAETIIKLYEAKLANPDKLKKEARQIAEQHYDIIDTVKGLVKIGEGLI